MSNYFNNKPFKPTKVGIIKAVGQKIISKIKGKGKVSPDIKSVKPNLKKTTNQTKSDEFRKRYQALDKAEGQIKTGKKMMKEGQKTRKKMTETGRAFQFKHSKSFHAIKPGEKNLYKGLTKEEKPKKFKTGKQLEAEKKARENKMGGGMMGRRMGYSRGTPKIKTNVEKIKKAFPTKTKIKFDAKKSDLDKSGDLSKYEKARGMAIAKAMAKRNKKV